jgi:hypothetical protein
MASGAAAGHGEVEGENERRVCVRVRRTSERKRVVRERMDRIGGRPSRFGPAGQSIWPAQYIIFYIGNPLNKIEKKSI